MNKTWIYLSIIFFQSAMLIVLAIQLNNTTTLMTAVADPKYSNPLYWQSSIDGDDPNLDEWLALHGYVPPAKITRSIFIGHSETIDNIGTQVNTPVQVNIGFGSKAKNINEVDVSLDSTNTILWDAHRSYLSFDDGTRIRLSEATSIHMTDSQTIYQFQNVTQLSYGMSLTMSYALHNESEIKATVNITNENNVTWQTKITYVAGAF